jgi:hypothetical protein
VKNNPVSKVDPSGLAPPYTLSSLNADVESGRFTDVEQIDVMELSITIKMLKDRIDEMSYSVNSPLAQSLANGIPALARQADHIESERQALKETLSDCEREFYDRKLDQVKVDYRPLEYHSPEHRNFERSGTPSEHGGRFALKLLSSARPCQRFFQRSSIDRRRWWPPLTRRSLEPPSLGTLYGGP